MDLPAPAPDTLLERLRWRADELADDTVARIVGPHAEAGVARLAAQNRLFAQWTDNASLAAWQADERTPRSAAR